jgi:hypothetical protein
MSSGVPIPNIVSVDAPGRSGGAFPHFTGETHATHPSAGRSAWQGFNRFKVKQAQARYTVTFPQLPRHVVGMGLGIDGG